MVNKHRQPQRILPMIVLTRSIRRIYNAYLTKCYHLFCRSFFSLKMMYNDFLWIVTVFILMTEIGLTLPLHQYLHFQPLISVASKCCVSLSFYIYFFVGGNVEIEIFEFNQVQEYKMSNKVNRSS